MTRTGVSDSELARTLGVSRQTIFRWKEGLTARPRSREDVQRCAQKLRLNSEERDALLLAAGFAPEHAQVPSTRESASAMPAEALENQTERPTALAPPEIHDASAHSGAPTMPAEMQSRRSHAGWLVAAGLALAVLALVLLFWIQSSPGFPVAGAGENLIIISRLVADDSAPVRGASLSDRVQIAIEREIEGQHVERTRVITWTEAIADASTALGLAQRAGASAVLWGTHSGDHWSVGLASSRPALQSNAKGLSALIAEPLTATLTLDPNATEDIQALALFTLAHLDAQQEEYGSAHAALTQALAVGPAAPRTRALLLFYSGYWSQVPRSPDLLSITEAYSQALALDADLLEAYLDRGLVFVRAKQPAGWEPDLMRVHSMQSDHPGAQLALCWAYALDLRPDPAVPYCDAAVAHDATARSREARAVVNAEAGRIGEAAADLAAFLDWLAKQPEPLRARYGNTRAEWLQALQAGQNPFNDQVLAQLRAE